VRVTSLAATIHKWLALVMAVPILFWFASGLFFALAPMEKVRSEHVRAAQPPVALSVREIAAALQMLPEGESGKRIEIRSLLGRPVALVEPGAGRPRLYDLGDGRLLSPIPAALAAEIAEADHAGDARAARVIAITEPPVEYRGGPLPAWRVDFDDGEGRSIYVAQDTGAVVSRRSTLWRVYDFLWALHILDFSGHEDYGTPLLAIATALALLVLVTGSILFPVRLGLTAWLRRRRRRRAQPG
jgi:uncharacterized iron-regulated membrane protein